MSIFVKIVGRARKKCSVEKVVDITRADVPIGLLMPWTKDLLNWCDGAVFHVSDGSLLVNDCMMDCFSMSICSGYSLQLNIKEKLFFIFIENLMYLVNNIYWFFFKEKGKYIDFSMNLKVIFFLYLGSVWPDLFYI
jgi:hypothetical protein